MSDPQELDGFKGICRLFPLGGVVMFPHSVLPLHIFEPRYRQMTRDALADDQLIAIANLAADGGVNEDGEPNLAPVACLGRVVRHQELPDGRFSLLLQGIKRVRLISEINDPEKLYRQARVELLDDLEEDSPSNAQRHERLLDLFRDLFPPGHSAGRELLELLESDLSLGAVTDIVSHALNFPPPIKQALLEEVNVAHRADQLIKLIRPLAPQRPRWPVFPPPPSLN
ncbi:peptidase S16 lon domain protein [Isosphaera pallida ATCC 43644]|jgi:Lon protease-like protein|uniref:Peptidase S16 lon domain protein n=1 Tax=Isosphaera pallida (strain ATCC 43644 / DSM 9630 / IS1B) TaxID=575540 RepID=E8R3F7_ISOPI|nr:LON peptidase substrate-binding domain-containing protein [Isosphaera pallida]ADV63667.1 peptidase S16 lon domain protein [Isosphaera pallida ATCC 43644]